jgi:hypothetical protein
MTPASAAPADSPPVSHHAFDRAALAILGTMVSLILVLATVLIAVSTAPTAGPAPTAQTSPPPHRA